MTRSTRRLLDALDDTTRKKCPADIEAHVARGLRWAMRKIAYNCPEIRGYSCVERLVADMDDAIKELEGRA